MRRHKVRNVKKDRMRFGKSIKKTNSLNLSSPARGGYRI